MIKTLPYFQTNTFDFCFWMKFVLTCSCFAELVNLKPGYRVLCDAILSNLYLDPASQLQKQLLILQHLKEDMQQLDWPFS